MITLFLKSENSTDFAWAYFMIIDQDFNKQSNPDNLTYTSVDEKTLEKIMTDLGYIFNLANHDMLVGDRIVRLLGNIQTKELCLVESEHIQPYMILDMIRYTLNT